MRAGTWEMGWAVGDGGVGMWVEKLVPQDGWQKLGEMGWGRT